MSYYPVFLQLEDRHVLVIGGGTVAARKVETLLNYGAIVHVVSRDLNQTLRNLMDDGKIRFLGDRFEEKQLEGMFLVIAATDDAVLNHQISEGPAAGDCSSMPWISRRIAPSSCLLL
ncbi:MAG: NAD(P)-dependent oxidoreductase [Deltaproteobacteria bacterium]|nr:NAD(P)-dependent oxidoreductase [Deltaproteobacteria bacterium]